jgi:hypothetical protein
MPARPCAGATAQRRLRDRRQLIQFGESGSGHLQAEAPDLAEPAVPGDITGTAVFFAAELLLRRMRVA